MEEGQPSRSHTASLYIKFFSRVIYKTMCYNVPRSQCTQSACSGGTNLCPPDSSYCSSTNFNSGTVCPELDVGKNTKTGHLARSDINWIHLYIDDSSAFVGSGLASSTSSQMGGCQTVRTPQCGNPTMCNSGSQQCCITTNEQVNLSSILFYL